jgi:predicted DCC family thiol-disulfide oxidoreductase YuxK
MAASAPSHPEDRTLLTQESIVLRHDRREQFRFASLQSQFASETLRRHGQDPGDLSTLYVIVDPRGPRERLLAKSRAVLYVLRQVGGPWSVSRVLAGCPTGVLDAAYDLVARNRYSIFGESRTCLLAAERWKGRFLDS